MAFETAAIALINNLVTLINKREQGGVSSREMNDLVNKARKTLHDADIIASCTATYDIPFPGSNL